MRKAILQILLLTLCMALNGQVTVEHISGQVSYVSIRNIYVKFKSTAGIVPGDTLFIQSDGSLLPVLIVNDLSSSSCISTALGDRLFSVADPVIARIKRNEAKAVEIIPEISGTGTSVRQSSSDSLKLQEGKKVSQQHIHGSISLNSYSDLSNTISDNTHRFRYTLSLEAGNIGNSRFSVQSYISFKYKTGEWEDVRNDVFSALKIYSLAARYDLNATTHISLGRRINPRISSVGAVDGLQVEKSLGGLSIGALAGFRPDYKDYGFNGKLFQYGLYFSYRSGSLKAQSESSVAFMQQMNDFKTDRRFIYFQHSSTFIKKLNFFSTIEFDLYKLNIDSLNNEQSRSTFDLTGLYISLRYKILRNLTLWGSYDARKNIIYYETYRTFFDRILETELRQGFRLQANYRIAKDLLYGVRAGYRFLRSDPGPSKNLYTWFTYNQIPGINMSATLSATYIESGHINGKAGGIYLNRDFLKERSRPALVRQVCRLQDDRNPDQHLSEYCRVQLFVADI